MDTLLPYLILTVPSLLLMGVVRLIGIRHPAALLLASMLGGALAGAFLAAAVSALATAVDQNAAVLRTGLMGAGAGLVIGAVVLLLARLVAGANG